VNKHVILIVSLLALVTVGALPWLWRWSPAAAWLFALAIGVWCVWLMVLYLKWARALGRTSPDQSTAPTATIAPSDGGGSPSAQN
jgi:protein-S-isoprenylcysteine O-methyltransferase Ste14